VNEPEFTYGHSVMNGLKKADVDVDGWFNVALDGDSLRLVIHS